MTLARDHVAKRPSVSAEFAKQTLSCVEGGICMLIVFQVCFFVGIGLIVISFLLGNLFDAIGIDGFDLDIDFLGNTVFIPSSPVLLELFFMVFGGIGWILIDVSPSLAMLLIIPIATAVGLFVSILVYQLVLKPLKKAQNTSTPNAQDLVGLRATVTETICSGGFGEIGYVINGNSFNSPAKATNGGEIKTGKDVAICWIEDHVFYVSSLDDIGTKTNKVSV
jgi:membrane protein implicated in regulation of membrane protease activity